VVNSGRVIDTNAKQFEVLNGTLRDHVIINHKNKATFSVTVYDMYGKKKETHKEKSTGSVKLKVPAGGRIEVTVK
jgi:hypothetical protein